MLHLWVPPPPEADGVLILPQSDEVLGCFLPPVSLLLVDPARIVRMSQVLEVFDDIFEDAVEEEEDDHAADHHPQEDQLPTLHILDMGGEERKFISFFEHLVSQLVVNY